MGSGSSSLPPPPSTLPLIIEEFFIVVYEDPLVKKELPKKFADYLDGKEPAKVYLRAADCGPRLWTMEVLFDGQGRMYLDKGWEKFAIAHGVDFGWFVHFKYEGDDVLTVKVFDGTMCRRCKPRQVAGEEELPWWCKELEEGKSKGEEGRKKKEEEKREREGRPEPPPMGRPEPLTKGARPAPRSLEVATRGKDKVGTTDHAWPVLPASAERQHLGRGKGGPSRYLSLEAPARGTAQPIASQYMLRMLPGTSGGASGRGTARTPEPLDTLLRFDAFSGTWTGTFARGTARTSFSSDLNR
ncbi:hypothetical protein QYE76_041070 [Lolium multiflorum]|uniref:TF-B3 domain-containing protein n=1 Tax=Lolium multiflorum TaxID=4521 RepID=A0AAD8WTC2_LOLMU|nr:hypothetical protein QYE76_041070 [Lolium multiflorum]